MTTRENKIRGCLIGGAVGDALGADVEFLSIEEIRAAFGAAGVTDYTSEPAAFTDDTQMTLFTAEGLLSEGDPLLNIHQAYLRWRLTQQPNGRAHPASKIEHCGLLGLPEMHRRRAPGHTCLSALDTPYRPGQPAVNTSKGCGGIMRMAPIGLWAPHIGDDRAVFELAMKAARLTHGHASGHLSAGYFAVMIAALLRGETVPEAVKAANAPLTMHRAAGEVWRALEAAIALATKGPPTPEALATLGGGWTGEEALAIAVCCAMTASSFSDGVLRAVNHSGDCDSTAAITGNLLGALYGVSGIPQNWLAQLELRDVIDDFAARLAA